MQCLAAWLPLRRNQGRPVPRDAVATNEGSGDPAVAVVVPAHNEAEIIERSLYAILRELTECDRLLVVADNCSDETARVATAVGATVVERNEPSRRGKGYALNHAVGVLSANPPDVVVFIDADCVPRPGSIREIAAVAHHSGRPVQAAYWMHRPPGEGPKSAVSALAVAVKNVVRPRGLQNLGLPCPLTGSGMAIPWRCLQEVEFPATDIVEDMAYGVELAIAGYPPRPWMQANVDASLPDSRTAASLQRRRWEHGHLQSMLRYCPRLVWQFLKSGRAALLVMALDIGVPPLSLLVMLHVALLCMAIGFGLATGGWLPAGLTAGGLGLMAVAVLGSWWRFARNVVSPRELLAIPRYAALKMPMYGRFVRRREREWIRTARNAGAKHPVAPPHVGEPQPRSSSVESAIE